MPTYILLEFDNDNEAFTFAYDMFRNPSAALLTPVQENKVRPKIWGIFRKPTDFCACVGGGGRKGVQGFTRGRLFGWWVCGVCKRPTARWASGSQWFSVLGANLLPRSLRPYPEAMDTSLESPAVWAPLLDAFKAAQEDLTASQQDDTVSSNSPDTKDTSDATPD